MLHYRLLKDFDQVPVVERFQEVFEAPVFIEDNIRAAAYAELLRGRGQGLRNFLCLAVAAPGVGLGIVIDGKLYRGANQMAGEAGHHSVSTADGPQLGYGTGLRQRVHRGDREDFSARRQTTARPEEVPGPGNAADADGNRRGRGGRRRVATVAVDATGRAPGNARRQSRQSVRAGEDPADRRGSQLRGAGAADHGSRVPPPALPQVLKTALLEDAALESFRRVPSEPHGSGSRGSFRWTPKRVFRRFFRQRPATACWAAEESPLNSEEQAVGAKCSRSRLSPSPRNRNSPDGSTASGGAGMAGKAKSHQERAEAKVSAIGGRSRVWVIDRRQVDDATLEHVGGTAGGSPIALHSAVGVLLVPFDAPCGGCRPFDRSRRHRFGPLCGSASRRDRGDGVLTLVATAAARILATSSTQADPGLERPSRARMGGALSVARGCDPLDLAGLAGTGSAPARTLEATCPRSK